MQVGVFLCTLGQPLVDQMIFCFLLIMRNSQIMHSHKQLKQANVFFLQCVAALFSACKCIQVSQRKRRSSTIYSSIKCFLQCSWQALWVYKCQYIKQKNDESLEASHTSHCYIYWETKHLVQRQAFISTNPPTPTPETTVHTGDLIIVTLFYVTERD